MSNENEKFNCLLRRGKDSETKDYYLLYTPVLNWILPGQLSEDLFAGNEQIFNLCCWPIFGVFVEIFNLLHNKKRYQTTPSSTSMKFLRPSSQFTRTRWRFSSRAITFLTIQVKILKVSGTTHKFTISCRQELGRSYFRCSCK